MEALPVSQGILGSFVFDSRKALLFQLMTSSKKNANFCIQFYYLLLGLLTCDKIHVRFYFLVTLAYTVICKPVSSLHTIKRFLTFILTLSWSPLEFRQFYFY